MVPDRRIEVEIGGTTFSIGMGWSEYEHRWRLDGMIQPSADVLMGRDLTEEEVERIGRSMLQLYGEEIMLLLKK